MKALKSHPNLFLHQHIAQVKLATEGIWQWHSEKVVTEKVKWLSMKLASLHDTGKGSDAFQEFINDPLSYNADPMQKAHTPLSLVLTLLHAKEEGWDSLDTLILAASAYGHHSGLPCMPGRKFGEEQSSSRMLDDFTGGPIARTLKKQLSTLNLLSLEQETGLSLKWSDHMDKSLKEADRFLQREVMPEFYTLPLENAIDFRLRAQLIFSFLLEADKAFLAVPDPKAHLDRKHRHWHSAWVDQKIGKCEDNPVNLIRKKARTKVIERTSDKNEKGIYSMTAPTGIGKTLLAATWALVKRETIEKETGILPKIIVVLPYLSIIDQTAKEYRSLLEISGQDVDGSWFLTSHSLSDRKFAPWMEAKTEHFFIDTWRTELVITTYDQFLLSLIEPRARYQMRFHNLCDALIIMDEVQSLPCKLWQLLDAVLNGLSKMGNSQILLMSATLPPFVSETTPLLENYDEYFRSFSRYELHLHIREKLHVQTFCENLAARLGEWLSKKERVLITLNTRKCARIVFDYLKDHWPDKYKSVPIFFLSADVTPKDRLKKIDTIKDNQPCIVVSTQCIEAGVDIDMGIVIRDFAPWDSIVQIAGRCNREGTRGKWLPVEIVDLANDKGQRYSEMIYDEVSLQVTRKLIESFSVIKEEEVLPVSDQYFKELDMLKDTGREHLNRFAQWQEDVSVRELLRGKYREQHSFLVIKQDPLLKKAMAEANSIDDRWNRREAWRKLSGRIAKITVNLYARSGFTPEEIATFFLGHWILRDGYYDSERGIMLENKSWSMDGDTLIF